MQKFQTLNFKMNKHYSHLKFVFIIDNLLDIDARYFFQDDKQLWNRKIYLLSYISFYISCMNLSAMS